MNLYSYLTYPLRQHQISAFKAAIKSSKTLYEKNLNRYQYLQFLLEQNKQHKLSYHEVQHELLDALLVLFDIGALRKFEELLQALDYLRGETRYQEYMVLLAYMHNDFENMKFWLKKAEHSSANSMNIPLITNNVCAAAQLQDDVFYKYSLEQLEQCVFQYHSDQPEALTSLMWAYEQQGKEEKIKALCQYCENLNPTTWQHYLSITDVIYFHNRRLLNIKENQQLVQKVIKNSKRYHLTTEENLIFEIYQVKLLFENRFGEWEEKYISLLFNREKYLKAGLHVLRAFTNLFITITDQSYQVYGKRLQAEIAEAAWSAIQKATQEAVPKIEKQLALIDDKFLYEKLELLRDLINAVKLQKQDAAADQVTLKEQEYRYQKQALKICQYNNNQRKYLRQLVILADDLIAYDKNIDITNHQSELNDLAETLSRKREHYLEIIRSTVDDIDKILKKHEYNPSLAYDILYTAYFYDFLKEEDKAREILIHYDETHEDYRNYAMAIYHIYIYLHLKYKTITNDPNLHLLEKIQELESLNQFGKTKEAGILSRDIFQKLELVPTHLPAKITRETLLTFLEIHARSMLNFNYLNECLDAIQWFNNFADGYQIPPILDNAKRLIQLTAESRKGNIDVLRQQLATTLSDSNLIPHYRIQFLILQGRLEARDTFPEFKITSFCEALGLAEEQKETNSIIQIYEELAGMFVHHYPALAISMLRQAESVCKLSENHHHLPIIALHKAQVYASFRERPQQYNNDDIKMLENEAYQLIHSVDRAALSTNEQIFYDRVRSVVFRDLPMLWQVFHVFCKIGGNLDALQLAERIIILASSQSCFEDARSAAQRYREIAIKLNDKTRIQHADQIIKELSLGHTILPPEVPKQQEETTLLDILEQISLEEERFALDKSPVRQLFPFPDHEGMCLAMDNGKDGSVVLAPVCPVPFTYYRGQSERYPLCKPSLYRQKMTSADQYLERLRFMEFKQLIDTHPIVDKYTGGFTYRFPDGEKRLPFQVYHLALAQHYGIKTELMDVTADKWVAAFFAATSWQEDDRYEPYHGNQTHGVFYICKEQMESLDDAPKILPIGIQPFPRPGEQRGYVYPLHPDENFEDKCTIQIFKHDARVNELIFNFTNRAKKLFPYDTLKKKVELIKRPPHCFSESTRHLVQLEYYPDTTPEILEGYCRQLNITFQRDPITSFTEADLQEYHRNLKTFEQYMQNNIIVQPIFNIQDNIPIFFYKK